MSYICPKDKTKLLWKDFLNKGRWFCRKCLGTLVFEKHLITFPNSTLFFDYINVQNPLKSQLECPVCEREMKMYPLVHNHRKIEIDQCQGCKSFWFDAGEIKQLTALTKLPSTNIQSPLDSMFSIFSQRLHEVELRAKRFRLVLVAVYLVTSGFFIFKFFPIAHEYGGFVGIKRLDPLGSAVIAFVLTLLYAINSEFFALAALFVPFFLFASALIWLARL